MKPALRLLLMGGAWTPARLFSNGEQGAWYDPSDASALFQDSAGTTAGVIGQPVGRILDRSGRANHAIQATAASRPTLVQTGPYYGLRADGGDDSLSSATGGGGTAGILVCAAITVSGGAGTERVVWGDRGALSGYIVMIDSSNRLLFLAGNGAAFTSINGGTFNAGETHVLTVWDDGANLSAQIDNGAVGSVARPVVTAGSAGFTLFKNNTAASQFFNGDLHALAYVQGTAKDATTRAALKRWVGARAGLSL